MSAKKIPYLVKKFPVIVAKIPGSIAFNDLLERITDRGVIVDGVSHLAAIEHQDKTHLLAEASLQKVAGLSGDSCRRRGAPLPRRNS